MDRLELVLGEPAAGGGFVARDAGGRVVFVRHGLPGERVVAEVTEAHPTWARADAVEVLEASEDRVDAPCPYAGPGRCGGCDYQHVALPVQRTLKRRRLAEQLRAVGGVELAPDVEALAPERGGLATRTRVRFAVDDDGRLSMRRNRSHALVAVARCALAVAAIDALDLAAHEWPPLAEVEVVSLDATSPPTLAVTAATRPGERSSSTEVLDAPGFSPRQPVDVAGLHFDVGPGVFWQVHERGPAALVDAVLHGLALAPGDQVADLYCGAGLFTAAAARAVGPTGGVVGVDASRAATADARRAVASMPWARIVTARVESRAVAQAAASATHAVLDPPRRGVDRGALAALTASGPLRRLVSVSCDPSTFARDLRRLLDGGWRLVDAAALDLFEMTEHVECVAVLER